MAINGISKITERILAEAREDAERILADAEAERKRISAEYTTRAAEIRRTLSAEAEREATDLVSRAKASAANQKRNLLLETQSDLIDEVFERSLADLKNLETGKYTELLIGLLSAAFLEQLEAEKIGRELYGEEELISPEIYEVLLCNRDRERCGKALIEGTRKRLAAKVSEEDLRKLKLSAQTVEIDGGLILRYGDIESNCSFSLLFAQLREELESDVSHALFDQTDKRI